MNIPIQSRQLPPHSRIAADVRRPRIPANTHGEAPPGRGLDEQPLRTRQLLLIEDDTNIATLLQLVAAGRDLEITHAASGHESLRLATLAAAPPDVIVIDHGLPDTLGDTVARWMRELFGDDPVIVAFSAAANAGVAAQMLEAGCDAYLDKVAGFDALLELIDDLLAATPEARRAELRARYRGRRA